MLDEVEDVDDPLPDADERPVAVIGGHPLRASHGRRRVAPLGTEVAFALAEQASDRLFCLLYRGRPALDRLRTRLEVPAEESELDNLLARDGAERRRRVARVEAVEDRELSGGEDH